MNEANRLKLGGFLLISIALLVIGFISVGVGKLFEPRGIRDIVPRDIFLDFILRYAGLIDFHLYRTGRVGHTFDEVV